MRIAYVLNGLGICGGVRIVFEHANRLAQRGYDVSIATSNGETTQDWFPLEVPVHGWHTFPGADVIVATEWSTAPLVHEYPSGKKFYFVQMREPLFSPSQSWQRRAEATYSLPLQAITISRWLKEFLEEKGHSDVPIVANGVNPVMFYPEPALPRKPGLFRVLIEGHEANAAKNVRDAHAALAVLRRTYPIEVWGFNQLGPGRYSHDRFWTAPAQDTIRRLYSSSDVLLKTSKLEGRGCSGPEAMACGCAVVHTECRGTDDLLNERNCLLVPYGDLEAIGKAVERLITNEPLRQSLIAGGIDYVSTHLNWEASIAKLEELYAS